MTIDRDAHLRAAASAKATDALARARRAIVALENRGQPINFNTVATEAGVSKGYLYRQPDLRRSIAEKRPSPPAAVARSARQQASADSVAAKKLAVAVEALKSLRAEVQALREENARLRGDVAEERRRRVL